MIKVFTVFDTKAEAYLQPFFMQTRGQAIRAWSDSVNDEQTQFFRHPADFVLYEIGEYDELQGTIRMYDAKISLGVALEFHKTPPTLWSKEWSGSNNAEPIVTPAPARPKLEQQRGVQQ